LGELERAVLDHLWRAGPCDVTSVHGSVGEARGITRNTVQSTLERLCRKRLAAREKRGRAYIYAAAVSRREWLAESIHELLGSLPGAADALAPGFVDLAERTSEALLDELDRRVRARRDEGDA
jgi:predicted transcriptional regulator